MSAGTLGPDIGAGSLVEGGSHVLRPGVDLSHGVLLYLEGITVSFDGFRALDDLTLTIDSGELRCLIGPNGAGKSTLMDVITGRTRPQSGRAFLGQTIDLLKLSEADIARAGIGRKFQRPTVFEPLTVETNLQIACAERRDVFDTLMRLPRPAEKAAIEEVLETIGLTDERRRLAGTLSHGQKQWLEIGMLLGSRPRLLLLDEPVAGMTPAEIERTASLLQRLAGEHTVVVVEHDMDFVRSIAQRVTVLHAGRVLAEGDMARIQSDPKVIEVYLGG
jgi:urea transport system ATP-binding protein